MHNAATLVRLIDAFIAVGGVKDTFGTFGIDEGCINIISWVDNLGRRIMDETSFIGKSYV